MSMGMLVSFFWRLYEHALRSCLWLLFYPMTTFSQKSFPKAFYYFQSPSLAKNILLGPLHFFQILPESWMVSFSAYLFISLCFHFIIGSSAKEGGILSTLSESFLSSITVYWMHFLLFTLPQVMVLLNLPPSHNTTLQLLITFPYFPLSIHWRTSQGLLALTFCPVSKSVLSVLGLCYKPLGLCYKTPHFQVPIFILINMAVWETASQLATLNQTFYFAPNFVHQKFEKGSAEEFSLGVTHAVAVRCQLGLQTSDDLTGLDVQDSSFIWLGADAGVSCMHIWAVSRFVHNGLSSMAVSGYLAFLHGASFP